jgi:hypothetical protein
MVKKGLKKQEPRKTLDVYIGKNSVDMHSRKDYRGGLVFRVVFRSINVSDDRRTRVLNTNDCLRPQFSEEKIYGPWCRYGSSCFGTTFAARY